MLIFRNTKKKPLVFSVLKSLQSSAITRGAAFCQLTFWWVSKLIKFAIFLSPCLEASLVKFGFTLACAPAADCREEEENGF